MLCSGIIGYRALKRAQLPPGGRLGIYGFGASAHLTAQLAIAQGYEVHVLTRGEPARRLALELGAASAGDAADAPPVPLDGAVLFAPAGELVPVALAALDQGGTLALAGIHLSDIPGLDYQRHLFRERTLTSVTANTRADGEELLRLAPAVGISPGDHLRLRRGRPGAGRPCGGCVHRRGRPERQVRWPRPLEDLALIKAAMRPRFRPQPTPRTRGVTRRGPEAPRALLDPTPRWSAKVIGNATHRSVPRALVTRQAQLTHHGNGEKSAAAAAP